MGEGEKKKRKGKSVGRKSRTTRHRPMGSAGSRASPSRGSLSARTEDAFSFRSFRGPRSTGERERERQGQKREKGPFTFHDVALDDGPELLEEDAELSAGAGGRDVADEDLDGVGGPRAGELDDDAVAVQQVAVELLDGAVGRRVVAEVDEGELLHEGHLQHLARHRRLEEVAKLYLRSLLRNVTHENLHARLHGAPGGS